MAPRSTGPPLRLNSPRDATMAHPNSFGSRASLTVGSRSYTIFRLDALRALSQGNVDRLPFSLKVLLENLLRGEDGALGSYRKALKQSLPQEVRAVVQRQQDGAQRNHDQIKALRDSLRASG